MYTHCLLKILSTWIRERELDPERKKDIKEKKEREKKGQQQQNIHTHTHTHAHTHTQSLAEDGILHQYMFGKAHGCLCSTPSLRSFLSIAFEFNTVSMLVWLMVALLQPSKAYHWEFTPFYAPLRWFTVWCPWLDMPAARVASSSTLGTNPGYFAQQSICSPCTGMSSTVCLRESSKMDAEHCQWHTL